jgi:hypothetical protein
MIGSVMPQTGSKRRAAGRLTYYRPALSLDGQRLRAQGCAPSGWCGKGVAICIEVVRRITGAPEAGAGSDFAAAGESPDRAAPIV